MDRRTSLADQVRRCFLAYETGDRAAMEPLVADDFTFTSPYDDHIDRAEFFERCFPTAGAFAGFHLDRVTVDGDDCFVAYTAARSQGGRVNNVERWRFSGDQLRSVEVFFGLPPETKPELSPDDAIRQLLEQRALAVRDKDARTTADLYAREAVEFGLAPPLQIEAAALHDPSGLERWFAGWQGPIETELRDLRITARGDIGVASALQRLLATNASRQRVDLWSRVTYAFCKEAGAWKILHVHQSVPFAMDGSFRALTDLAP